MPLPLIPLAIFAVKAIAAKAATAKTIAVAAKGAAALTKAASAHGAIVGKTVAIATKTYGATTVLGATAFAAVTVGAAIVIKDKALRLHREIQAGNAADAVLAASSLMSELGGLGGLEDVRSTLNDFVSVSGNGYTAEVLQKTSSMIAALDTRIATA